MGITQFRDTKSQTKKNHLTTMFAKKIVLGLSASAAVSSRC